VKVNRQRLLDALDAVRPGLSDREKEVILQSGSFVFRNGRVFTYNDRISVSAPVSLGFDGALHAESLSRLLSDMNVSDEEVEVEAGTGEVRFSANRLESGLALKTDIVLPLINLADDSPDTWGEVPEKFAEAMRVVSYACARDLSTPALTCVHIDTPRNAVEAMDNFRATHYKLPPLPANFPASLLIPSASVAETTRYEFTHGRVSEDGAWLHLRTLDDVWFSCRTGIGADKYPDLVGQGVFEVDGGSEITLPKSLIGVLERSQVFAARAFFLDEESRVTLKKGRIYVRSEGPTGWVEENLNLRWVGEPVSFFVNPGFFKYMLTQTLTCKISKERMRFEGAEGWTHSVALTAGDGVG
jgi:hypothetical protein